MHGSSIWYIWNRRGSKAMKFQWLLWKHVFSSEKCRCEKRCCFLERSQFLSQNYLLTQRLTSSKVTMPKRRWTAPVVVHWCPDCSPVVIPRWISTLERPAWFFQKRWWMLMRLPERDSKTCGMQMDYWACCKHLRFNLGRCLHFSGFSLWFWPLHDFCLSKIRPGRPLHDSCWTDAHVPYCGWKKSGTTNRMVEIL